MSSEISRSPAGQPQVGCCGTERARPRVCMAGELAGAACEPWAAGAERGTALEQLLRGAGGLCRRAEPKSGEEMGAIGTCGLAGGMLRGAGIAVYKYIKGVNTTEGRELFQLGDNAGARTNGTKRPCRNWKAGDQRGPGPDAPQEGKAQR